jgi:hypothetical protein
VTDEEFQALLARVDCYRDAVRLKGGDSEEAANAKAEVDEARREWFDRGQRSMQARIVKGLTNWWSAAKSVAGRHWPGHPHAVVCKVSEIDCETTEGRP